MRIRRTLFSALMLIGLTGTMLAQTPARAGEVVTANGTRIQVTYGRRTYQGVVVQMSEGVSLTIDGTTIVANEATVDVRAGEIKLNGDVRLKIR